VPSLASSAVEVERQGERSLASVWERSECEVGETLRILVVEDEQAVADFLKQGLESDQYAVEVVRDGEQALARIDEVGFDLMVLDLVLPKLDGFQVLARLRAQKSSLPVLVLSGRASVEDRVRGLDLGADDYLPKPFSFSELSARVRALLRRSPDRVAVILRVEDLELDRVERVVKRADRPISLTPHEFSLLEFLMLHAGEQVTRDMIAEHVWNLPSETARNSVDVYINYLRKKVDQRFEKKLIHTSRGVGYQLGGEVKTDGTA